MVAAESCSGSRATGDVREAPRQRCERTVFRHRVFAGRRWPVAETLRRIAPAPTTDPGSKVGLRIRPVCRCDTGAAFGHAGWSSREGRDAFGWFGRNGAKGEAPSGGSNGASEGTMAFGLSKRSKREAGSAFGQFEWSVRREGHRKMVGTERARSRKGLRVVRVERAKRGTSQDDPNGAKPRDSRSLRVHGVEQTAKLGAVFGQHERSEPPKPDVRADLRESQRIEVRRQGSRWQHRLPNCIWGYCARLLALRDADRTSPAVCRHG